MSATELLNLSMSPELTAPKTNRRTFLITSALIAAGTIVAAAGASHIPEREGVPADDLYSIFPGWLEHNLGDENIPLLDRNGFVRYQSALMHKNPLIRNAYSDFMKELIEMRTNNKPRLRLGDSFQRAFDHTARHFRTYPDTAISPRANPLRELVHSGLIVQGKAYNWYGSIDDLAIAGIDISNLQKTTDLYQDKDTGLLATVMPQVFGYTPQQIKAYTRSEQLTSVSGGDHGPHIAQHATLTEQVEYYRRYNLESTAPLPVTVKWYADRAKSDYKAAQRTSWLAGHLHEIIGTLKPWNWRVFEQRPAEGYLEVHGNAKQDLKANHLGRLIAERLILMADQQVSFEQFIENISVFFDSLNDLRYLSASTPATLDLPPILFDGLPRTTP